MRIQFQNPTDIDFFVEQCGLPETLSLKIGEVLKAIDFDLLRGAIAESNNTMKSRSRYDPRPVWQEEHTMNLSAYNKEKDIQHCTVLEQEHKFTLHQFGFVVMSVHDSTMSGISIGAASTFYRNQKYLTAHHLSPIISEFISGIIIKKMIQ